MHGPEFSYDKFSSLKGSELVDYMEEYVCDPRRPVPISALEQMAAELEGYDDYHRVYAIEIGMDRMPLYFSPLVVSSLSHGDQSVRLAAHRRLIQLKTVSYELIDACEEAINVTPKHEDVADIVDRLRQLPNVI